jgi:predicted nucleotidyltransferase
MSAEQLEIAAELLGPIRDEVVFVGGATVHLWFTEPDVPAARATDDVDVICEVATRARYYELGERLRKRGFQEAPEASVLCRWRSVEPRLVLDVMPTDPAILGFSNPWYGEVMSTAATVTLGSGVQIRTARPVQLIATKLCAWQGRGRGDLLASLDVHDVLALVDGRPELIDELSAAPPTVRDYVRTQLAELRDEGYFGYAVDGMTAAHGPSGAGRALVVRRRFDELVA